MTRGFGVYVATTVIFILIAAYIRNQLMEDEMVDQMTIKEYVDPFTGDKNKKA